MKLKETKNGNLKLTVSRYEADIISSVVSYVRLGDGPNSDVIFELLCLLDLHDVEPSVEVKFDYNEDEGHTLNV